MGRNKYIVKYRVLGICMILYCNSAQQGGIWNSRPLIIHQQSPFPQNPCFKKFQQLCTSTASLTNFLQLCKVLYFSTISYSIVWVSKRILVDYHMTHYRMEVQGVESTCSMILSSSLLELDNDLDNDDNVEKSRFKTRGIKGKEKVKVKVKSGQASRLSQHFKLNDLIDRFEGNWQKGMISTNQTGIRLVLVSVSWLTSPSLSDCQTVRLSEGEYDHKLSRLLYHLTLLLQTLMPCRSSHALPARRNLSSEKPLLAFGRLRGLRIRVERNFRRKEDDQKKMRDED